MAEQPNINTRHNVVGQAPHSSHASACPDWPVQLLKTNEELLKPMKAQTPFLVWNVPNRLDRDSALVLIFSLRAHKDCQASIKQQT